MTHAIVARQPGGPEVLDFTEIERPVPGPGQLLVKVAATGVNFIETYQRSGTYKVNYPFTPGSEAAGVVEEIGEGVEDYTVGSRVATAEGTACYAGYTVLDAVKALPVPDGVDDHTAAALPLQGMTAHYLINSSFRVEPGHNVLVHAGAGGVGLLLIQLLKARGARVITTVSTDEKESLARGAGADEVLRYDGFADAARDLTHGAGVNVVYDGVGKDTFDGSHGQPAHPRFAGALRCGIRPGPARGSAAPQCRRLADPDAPVARALPRQPAGTAVAIHGNLRRSGRRQPQRPHRCHLSVG